MSAAIGTITNVDSTRDSFVVYGTVNLTGNYPGVAGDTLSFAGFDQIKSSSPPTWVDIEEFPAATALSPTVPSGLDYGFAPGTTQANGALYLLGGASQNPGVPLTLGTKSAVASLSAFSANGVLTVTIPNTLLPGQFVVLSGGASSASIFLTGVILQVVTASATQFTANFAAAKSLTYASVADILLTYQVVQAGPGNNLQLGTTVAPVTAVAVASNVLTVTAANSFVRGNFVVLQGLAAGEVPQGAVVQILTASATGFTANIIAPNLSATTGETATATLLVTNGGAPLVAGAVSTINGTTVAATAASATAAGLITALPVTQDYIPSNLIIIQGLTHGAALNGGIYQVLATGLSATNLEANGYIATAVTTGTADSGTAALLVTGSPTGGGIGPTSYASLGAANVKFRATFNKFI